MSDSIPSEYLSADELLDYEDIQEEDVVIPEWGNRKVRVRGLTLEQMAALATKATKRDPRGGQDIVDREASIALTVYYGLVSPKLKLEDVGKLKAKSAMAITRIVQAINALGATQDAIDDATKSDAAGLNGTVSIFPSARTGDDAL
jgi:hypothetical protein